MHANLASDKELEIFCTNKLNIVVLIRTPHAGDERSHRKLKNSSKLVV